MPKDKLDQQWSENDTQIANDYTSQQGQTYAKQGQRGSSSNRAHADFSYGENIGGTSQVKPVAPDCDGMQFARNPYDSENYLSVNRDKWNNEIPKDRSNHTPMPAGDMGQFGGNQYAEFQKSDQDGYGVVIEHGQSAAFGNVQTVYIDNSKADRGPDQ